MDAIDKINVLLAQKGMSGADLERQIGVSNSVYSQWNTKLTKPSKKSLLKVAEALGVDVSEILPDEKKKEKATADNGSGLSKEAIEMGRIFDAAAPEIKERMKDVVDGKATVKTAVNVVDVKCPLDGTMQKIYQNVIKVDDKVFPGTTNNGCEMYHPCQECEVCRMRAMFAELKGFSK